MCMSAGLSLDDRMGELATAAVVIVVAIGLGGVAVVVGILMLGEMAVDMVVAIGRGGVVAMGLASVTI